MASSCPWQDRFLSFRPCCRWRLLRLPRFVNVQIYRGLLDTSASENAARMSAMDNATRNCDEMVGALTLLFNKTRQTSITNELIDIVGGAEALK